MSEEVAHPLSDTEAGNAQIALVKQDPGFLTLPAPLKAAVDQLFLPPQVMIGDKTGQAARWTPVWAKLDQKGSKSVDGSRRTAGKIYGNEEFPDEYTLVVLCAFNSRELFNPIESGAGMLCCSPDGRVPSLRIEQPQSSDCWKCWRNSAVNKTVERKDKCRSTINLAVLTLDEPIGIHIMQFYGVSFMCGKNMLSELRKRGSLTQCLFTMTVGEHQGKSGINFIHQVKKIETVPSQYATLLSEIQKRAASWVDTYQAEEYLKSVVTSDSEAASTLAAGGDTFDGPEVADDDDIPMT